MEEENPEKIPTKKIEKIKNEVLKIERNYLDKKNPRGIYDEIEEVIREVISGET